MARTKTRPRPKKVPNTDLVEDFDIYPRGNIDSYTVNRYADAMIAGSEFPPIVADEESKRIVDGFHRRRAHVRAFGEGKTIEVLFVRHESEADVFADCVRHNAKHGIPIDNHDRVRIISIGRRLGIQDIELAGLMEITEPKMEVLAQRITSVKDIQEPAFLKNTNRHLAGGKPLTKKQRQGNDKAGGHNQLFYVNQVINLIENDLLDKENEKLMDGLRRLGSMIEEVMVTA